MAKPNGETTEIETLSGSVENVRFRNEETGYVVCDVKPAESMMSTVTVVGTCAAIWVGEELTAKGKWVTHPQYGRRFQADSIVCIARLDRGHSAFPLLRPDQGHWQDTREAHCRQIRIRHPQGHRTQP